MRGIAAVLMMVAWPAIASAQSTLAPVPPLPPIGLPLPQISGPLTPIALTPPDARPQPDRRRARPGPRFDGKHRPSFHWPVIYFVDPYYSPFVTEVNTRKSITAESWSGSGEPTRPAWENVPVPAAPAPASEPGAPEPAAAPAAPPPPSTFYYIPGCYIGNVPPSEVVLPPNCDRTRMITRKP